VKEKYFHLPARPEKKNILVTYWVGYVPVVFAL